MDDLVFLLDEFEAAANTLEEVWLLQEAKVEVDGLDSAILKPTLYRLVIILVVPLITIFSLQF